MLDLLWESKFWKAPSLRLAAATHQHFTCSLVFQVIRLKTCTVGWTEGISSSLFSVTENNKLVKYIRAILFLITVHQIYWTFQLVHMFKMRECSDGLYWNTLPWQKKYLCSINVHPRAPKCCRTKRASAKHLSQIVMLNKSSLQGSSKHDGLTCWKWSTGEFLVAK